MPFNLCIPQAIGVPGEGGPPNWLQATPNSVLDTSLDDPRWRGATEESLGEQGTQEAEFRALCDFENLIDNEQPQTLYLSWNTTFDMVGTNYNGDSLFVGFIPDTSSHGSGPATIIEFTLNSGGTTGPDLNQPNFSIQPWIRSGSNWIQASSSGTWPTDTRLWVSSPTPWAFQVRIPLLTKIVQGPGGPDTGTILGTTFKMWYSHLVSMPGNNQLTQYTWPNGNSAYLVTNAGLPDPTAAPWGQVSVNQQCAQGISLTFNEIGTTNTPSSQINVNTTNPSLANNTFFANPTNNSGTPVPVGAITARFRLADWGASMNWQDIRGGQHVANTDTIPPANPGFPIHFDWSPDASQGDDVNNYVLHTHQCMLVELTSTQNIQFDNDSVVRNMDFNITASRFSRDALIDLRGLAPSPTGNRDMYLYLETINMPAFVDTGSPVVGITEAPSELLVGARSVTPKFIEQLPTYRVHAFYDTGEKVTRNGINHPLLQSLGKFGYFLQHDGPLHGWSTLLDGAEQLTPNYYKLARVPNDKPVTITTTIEALEHPGSSSGFMVQSTFGNKGNFELVVPHASVGLAHCWRDDDEPGFPWKGPIVFGTEVGHVDAASLIQSNFGFPGNLEVVARVGNDLLHFWRDSGPEFKWHGPSKFADGVSGNPALIQGRYGIRGNFELVVPLASDGIAHYWRDNDNPQFPWTRSTVFATQVGHANAVALIQSNFGQPGQLEVVARAGDNLMHFWRDSGEPLAWHGPTNFFTGATGIPGFIQSRFGTKGNFEVVTPVTKGGMLHLWRDNDTAVPTQWTVAESFGSGQVTAVSLLESNFTTSTNPAQPGPGNFEVAARIDNSTALYWRRDESPYNWDGPTAHACS